jgi:hypothetical protein
METQARPRSAARSRRSRWILAALAAIALGAAAFFVVRALTGDNDGGMLKGSSGNAFTIRYPAGWSPVSKEELARLPGRPIAMVRRTDRTAILTINKQRRATGSFDQVSRQLDRRLKKRIPDFRKVSSRTVTIRAGSALLYTYIRKRRGTVHTVVVVPIDAGSYTLNAVVASRARDAAREVGAIISSFDA